MEENIDKGNESRTKLRSRQLLTALSPLLSVFILGLTYGSSGELVYALSSLNSREEHTSSSDNELYTILTSSLFWMGSGYILLIIPCCWLSGILMEKFGRKKLLIVAYPFFIIGWLVIGFANDTMHLMIGRLICSLPAGLISPLVPVYLGEISDPGFRPVLLSMIHATLVFGTLIPSVLDALMTWRGAAILSAIVSLISWLFCITCRESPVWLMNAGQTDAAVKQWIHLRGWKSLEEYRGMEHASRIRSEQRRNRASFKSHWLRETFLSKHFLWPLTVLCILCFTSQFSGHNVITYLSSVVITVLFGYPVSVIFNLVVIGINFIVSIVVCILIPKINRRRLAIFSGMGAISSLFVTSFFYIFIIEFTWITHVCLLFFTICLTAGLLPLSWVFMGELFPSKLRSLGAGLACGFSSACFFVDVNMVLKLFDHLDPHSTLAFYGSVILVGTLLLCWKLPETRNKTLLEIGTIFDNMSDETHPADIEMTEQEF